MIAYNADSGKTTNIYTYIKTLIMTYCQRWEKNDGQVGFPMITLN